MKGTTAKRRKSPIHIHSLPKSVPKKVSSSSFRSLNFPQGCKFSFRILPPIVARARGPCPYPKIHFILCSPYLLIPLSPDLYLFLPLSRSPHHPIGFSYSLDFNQTNHPVGFH